MQAKNFKFIIDSEIFNRFSDTQIGYVVCKINNHAIYPQIQALKASLAQKLSEAQITKETLTGHPNIKGWREIYRTFGVKPSDYRSSVEALLRRVLSGKDIWEINGFVDAYNCASVISLFPMGGYDLSKIEGDICLRFAKDDEPFTPLGAEKPIFTNKKQVVYADEKQVICWLWNYKDASQTCIDHSTEYAIFFIDAAFQPKHWTLNQAVEYLSNTFLGMGATIYAMGVGDSYNPVAEFNVDMSGL